MKDSSDNSLSLVDRSSYGKVLSDLRRKHRLSYYLGKINPYSGKIILTEDDAEIYLEMLAMSIMYQQSASAAIAQADCERDGAKRQLCSAVEKIKKQDNEVLSLTRDLSRSIRQCRRSRIVSVLLVISLIFGAYYYRQEKEKNDFIYSSGFADGKSVGYDSGYNAGISSRSTSSGSSGNRFLNPSSSTSYKTAPRSGYSLDMTVYVSNSGGKIHLKSNCSGMKYYKTMTYGEACENGYSHCSKCF